MSIKKGTILVAIDKCIMVDTNDEALELNKEYRVTDITKGLLYIIDEQGDRHGFALNDYQEFFKVK